MAQPTSEEYFPTVFCFGRSSSDATLACVGGVFLATSGSCAVAHAGRGWGGSEMSQRIMSDKFDGLDATALRRCRLLAAKIANDLRNKRPAHFVDKLSLADTHASLERAVDVLSTVKGSQRGGVSDN